MHFSVTYSLTVKGSRLKEVECERCQRRYAYTARCEVTSSFVSPFDALTERYVTKRLRKAAQAKLAAALDKPQVAACPACGWYQLEMVRLYKRQRLSRNLKVAVFVILLLSGVTVFMLQEHLQLLPVILTSVCLVPLGVVGILHMRNDPNLDIHKTYLQDVNNCEAVLIDALAARQLERANVDALDERVVDSASAEQFDELCALLSSEKETPGLSARQRRRGLDAQQRIFETLRKPPFGKLFAAGVGVSLGAILDMAFFGPNDDHALELAIGGPILGWLVGLGVHMVLARTFLPMVIESQKTASASNRYGNPRIWQWFSRISCAAGLTVMILLAGELLQPTIHTSLFVGTGAAIGLLAHDYLQRRSYF